MYFWLNCASPKGPSAVINSRGFVGSGSWHNLPQMWVVTVIIRLSITIKLSLRHTEAESEAEVRDLLNMAENIISSLTGTFDSLVLYLR